MEAHSEEHVLSRESELKLIALSVNDLPRVWDLIEPELIRACEESRGEFTVPGILHNMGLHDGIERWRLLALVRDDDVQAVMVVCVTLRGDGKRIMDCLLAGGENAGDWIKVDPEFDAFAKHNGCTAVRIPCARKGWAKKLPHWKIRGHVMEREI